MCKSGPLILVDDDSDDLELLVSAIKSLDLKNEIKVFPDGSEALAYLYNTTDRPFIILSDVNMPKTNGIAFKKTIDTSEILKNKCIPFIFMSTASNQTVMKEACELSIQGFFQKGNTFQELLESLRIILKYWSLTKHTSL